MKKRTLKIIFILVMVIMITTHFSSTFAAINDNYIAPTPSTVDEKKLNEVSWLSSILRPIAYTVYCVGQVVELLFTKLSGLVSKPEAFPWADMIIFNEIPLLDINFINPSSGTLIQGLNTKVIRPLYFTILSLAIAFFSVAVLIMALKILFSAIAEEKAKYKAQLVNWLVGILMLFALHYFMAFVFYLNENLVRVASKIATENINKEATSLGTLSDLYRTKAVESYETQTISTGAYGKPGETTQTQVTTDINIQFCIMYTIFISQSLMFLLVYIKRFFYVIILAMLGPVIVVYDFFSKVALK